MVGYFVYTVEETRYLEFEHNDFICTMLTWIEWHGGKKRSLNSIRFQYDAAKYLELDVACFVEHAPKNQAGALPMNYFIECKVLHKNSKADFCTGLLQELSYCQRRMQGSLAIRTTMKGEPAGRNSSNLFLIFLYLL